MNGVKPGVNDLETLNPKLALEFDQKLNKELTPSNVSAKSNKKYWWFSNECGHSWDDSPNHRSGGRGCPFCAGKRVLAGFNDFFMGSVLRKALLITDTSVN